MSSTIKVALLRRLIDGKELLNVVDTDHFR